jgi:hypothetical protein
VLARAPHTKLRKRRDGRGVKGDSLRAVPADRWIHHVAKAVILSQPEEINHGKGYEMPFSWTGL